MSELAKAVDDYDRWLAPIWKLSDKDRFVALCRVVKVLIAKADAISAMPNTAADWQATADGLSMGIRMANKCCLEQPKNLDSALQDGVDATNAECIGHVHENFADLVKLVPGAPAIDTHASEPVMKK